MVGVYFLHPLEWGLEEARTVSELFPARAPEPGTGLAQEVPRRSLLEEERTLLSVSVMRLVRTGTGL